MTGNQAKQRRLAREFGVPPHQHTRVVARAATDAAELAGDVRDLDPTEVWGRLADWRESDPDRLLAVAVALAAMVPIQHHTAGQLLAWTDRLIPPADVRDTPRRTA